MQMSLLITSIFCFLLIFINSTIFCSIDADFTDADFRSQKKKKPCSSILGVFFFFLGLLKPCRISRFWYKSKKKKKKKTRQICFGNFSVFRRVIFATKKKKKIFKKKSQPTDPTRKVCPPVKRFLFILALWAVSETVTNIHMQYMFPFFSTN